MSYTVIQTVLCAHSTKYLLHMGMQASWASPFTAFPGKEEERPRRGRGARAEKEATSLHAPPPLVHPRAKVGLFRLHSTMYTLHDKIDGDPMWIQEAWERQAIGHSPSLRLAS